MASVEALQACVTIDYWTHILSPLDCWEVYVVLTDGLVAAKAAHRDALARHDHGRAADLLAEVVDLSELCATMAEGLGLMRLRYLRTGASWPLAPLARC